MTEKMRDGIIKRGNSCSLRGTGARPDDRQDQAAVGLWVHDPQGGEGGPRRRPPLGATGAPTSRPRT